MFIGEYTHTLDPKGRYIVPARFREDLGEKFYITKGLDRCLFVYTEVAWQTNLTELARLSSTNANTRRFTRSYFSRAIEAEPDKQFRVLIPASLREYANLERDIVTIGVANRLEIWDQALWQAYDEESAGEYEAVAELLADIRL